MKRISLIKRKAINNAFDEQVHSIQEEYKTNICIQTPQVIAYKSTNVKEADAQTQREENIF